VLDYSRFKEIQPEGRSFPLKTTGGTFLPAELVEGMFLLIDNYSRGTVGLTAGIPPW